MPWQNIVQRQPLLFIASCRDRLWLGAGRLGRHVLGLDGLFERRRRFVLVDLCIIRLLGVLGSIAIRDCLGRLALLQRWWRVCDKVLSAWWNATN